jgi:hypothetical protein
VTHERCHAGGAGNSAAFSFRPRRRRCPSGVPPGACPTRPDGSPPGSSGPHASQGAGSGSRRPSRSPSPWAKAIREGKSVRGLIAELMRAAVVDEPPATPRHRSRSSAPSRARRGPARMPAPGVGSRAGVPGGHRCVHARHGGRPGRVRGGPRRKPSLKLHEPSVHLGGGAAQRPRRPVVVRSWRARAPGSTPSMSITAPPAPPVG